MVKILGGALRALTFSFFALPTVAVDEPSSCTREPIIVIGAGLSGLAAARDLQDRGCKVIVLEASERLGGRSYSMKDDFPPWDFEHELGGQYIHGNTKANSVRWLADKFDIKAVRADGVNKYVRARDNTAYTQVEVNRGQELINEWYVRVARKLRLRVNRRRLSDKPLKDTSEQVIEENLFQMTEDERDLLDWHIALDVDRDWGISQDLWPLNGIDQEDGWWFLPIRGGDGMIKDGMGRIVDLLEVGDPDWPAPLDIRKEHVVDRIFHGDRACTVEYSHHGERGTLSGSACVCSIPLGVLEDSMRVDRDDYQYRLGDVQFVPELSAEKQIAIRTRGLAHINIMLIQWSTPFWRKLDPGIQSWSYVFPREGCDRPVGEIFGLFVDWYDVTAYKKDQKHFVLQFYFGADTYWTEKFSDRVLQSKAMETLRRYWGEENVPDPIGVKTSKWDQGDCSRGSYSGLWTHSSDREWYSLARPESKSLYFCGEHSNYDGRYQTMDGAYNTGIREAERIASRSWNVNDVSQESLWMNPNSFTRGWMISEQRIGGRRLNQMGTETVIEKNPSLYETTLAEKLDSMGEDKYLEE